MLTGSLLAGPRLKALLPALLHAQLSASSPPTLLAALRRIHRLTLALCVPNALCPIACLPPPPPPPLLLLPLAGVTKLAYFKDLMVGAIACRLEEKEPGQKKLYIMTLGVLATYRGRGIGTKLLEHVLANVSGLGDVKSIYLNVQSNNNEAIAFYEKFGFSVTGRIENYYKRLEPSDCKVLEKLL